MDAVELIGLAGSFSLLAGWRIYLCVAAAGLGMHFGWVPLPEHLAWLSALQSPWVIGAASFATVLELLADKIAWIDSIWDGIHTAVRPLGGALLSLAILDPQDPLFQVVTFLLGGGMALASHSAKSSARATINLSPEPYSNIAVSTGEDVTSFGLLAAVLASPEVAVVIFVTLLLGTIALLIAIRRLLRRARGILNPNSARQGSDP
jgi:hypothetical protein